MKISNFKDSIIRDRQKGFTYQDIADRFDCSRQHIQQLLKKWGATEPLKPTESDKKRERALEAVHSALGGNGTSIGRLARRFRTSEDSIRRAAKEHNVNLLQVIKLNRVKERAHRLDGQQFNGLKIVDGTCRRTENGAYIVEATCVVCGTRKVFCVTNLRAGYTKTCSWTCAARFKKGNYDKTPSRSQGF